MHPPSCSSRQAYVCACTSACGVCLCALASPGVCPHRNVLDGRFAGLALDHNVRLSHRVSRLAQQRVHVALPGGGDAQLQQRLVLAYVREGPDVEHSVGHRASKACRVPVKRLLGGHQTTNGESLWVFPVK